MILTTSRQIFTMLDSRSDSALGEAQVSSEVETPSGPISCYRKPEGEIGLVIPLSDEEASTFRPDVQSQAIKLTRLKIDGFRSVRLSLHAPHHRETFYIFADEVLQSIQEEPTTAASQAAALLQRWRQFFALVETSELSTEREIGVLCELEVLDHLLASGVQDAVQRWAGPDWSRHDFLLADSAIECKATLQTSGLTITIHGSHQLEPNADRPITLVVRRYELDPDGSLSIPVLINRICRYTYTPVELLLAKLSQVGVSLILDSDQSSFQKFTSREVYEFEVTEDFPRLTPVGLAGRVQNIRYSLDLADPESIPGFSKIPTSLSSTLNEN